MLLSLLLITIISATVAAQPPGEVPGFWGLRRNNHISVLVASSRRSEISVDGQPPVIQETSDSMQIRFTVAAFERTGDIIVRAIISQIDREPSAGALSRLNVAPVFLRIQPNGEVSTATPESRERLVMNLTNSDPESANTLKKCLTDETLASWFSVPFWMVGSPDAAEKKKLWNRTHDLSLGTLGTLQLEMSFQPGEVTNNFANVAIKSESRFRPLVLADAETSAFPFLSDVSVEVDEVSGTGRMFFASLDDDKSHRPRPEFESVEWTVQIHGKAKLLSAQGKKSTEPGSADKDAGAVQDVSDKAGNVTFKQTQHHLWTLQSFDIGNHQMFDMNRVPATR
ncbi:MAG: hypothetical protein O2856_10230 [Planctomycetota bacterium]|nr:hypothetical protein [Planctomycetota bacterium]